MAEPAESSAWTDDATLHDVHADPFGAPPLFYAITPHGVVYGPRASHLARLAALPLRLDPQAVYGALLGNGDLEGSLYHGVQRCPPGYRLRQDEMGVHCIAPAFSPESDQPSTQAEFEALLCTAIERCVDPHATCLLSGGLDSSLIAALAMKIGAHLDGIYVHELGEVDPDLPRAQNVAAHLGISLTVLELDPQTFPRQVVATICAAEALVVNSRAVVKHLLYKHVTSLRPGAVLLSGVGADEIFRGDPSAAVPALVSAAEARMTRELLRDPRCVEEAQSFTRNEALRTILALSTLPIECGLAAAEGLTVHLPFLDRDVVALAARVPHATLVRDGFGKSILREIGSRYLPRELCWQTKTPHWSSPGLTSKQARSAWHALFDAYLSPARLEPLQVVHPQRVRAFFEAYRNVNSGDERARLADRILMRIVSLVVLADDTLIEERCGQTI